MLLQKVVSTPHAPRKIGIDLHKRGGKYPGGRRKQHNGKSVYVSVSFSAVPCAGGRCPHPLGVATPHRRHTRSASTACPDMAGRRYTQWPSFSHHRTIDHAGRPSPTSMNSRVYVMFICHRFVPLYIVTLVPPCLSPPFGRIFWLVSAAFGLSPCHLPAMPERCSRMAFPAFIRLDPSASAFEMLKIGSI